MNLEYKAMRAQLAVDSQERDSTGMSFELGSLPGVPWQIVLAVTGEGNHATAVLAERAITRYQPWALLVVGVAGALKDDIDLGDVVVATWVHGFHGGKEDDEGFYARPRGWGGAHRLIQAARLAEIKGSWTGLLAQPVSPAVHFKPIAAGDVVLNSRESPLRRQLKGHHNDAAAIEMESAGASVAAHLNDSLAVLAVRGISDKADGDKHLSDAAGLQPLAAAHAAAFTVALLQEVALTADTPAGPVPAGPAAAGPPDHGMSWRPLDGELPVVWLPGLGSLRLGRSALLELHLVPAERAAPLEARRLAVLGNELSALAQKQGMFGRVDFTQGQTADEAFAAGADGPGLAVTRTGQRSAWLLLPGDGLGAVLDPADVRDRLATLLTVIEHIETPNPARVGLAVGVTTTTLLAEGLVSDLPRTTRRQKTSMSPVRVPPADRLPYSSITADRGAIAEELAARLMLAFRAQIARSAGGTV
jgi:nucleoside phosphorylase